MATEANGYHYAFGKKCQARRLMMPVANRADYAGFYAMHGQARGKNKQFSRQETLICNCRVHRRKVHQPSSDASILSIRIVGVVCTQGGELFYSIIYDTTLKRQTSCCKIVAEGLKREGEISAS
jgi:hypothetical protein